MWHLGKTPISYYGGKQRLASRIIKMIPKHTVYVEPFAGGAAVFFAKPWPEITNTHHYREVLNDTDGRLVNFYRQLRDNGAELVRRLQMTPYSAEEHRIAKQLECEDRIEAARRYFVNLNQSFANRMNGGWGRSVYGRNMAATWANRIDRLPELLDRLHGIHIECDDALKVIRQWDSPQTFFYCDPPYPGADCGHYKGYTLADFQALVDTLAGCQGSFLLSNYPQADAVIPQDWEAIQIQATSTAGRVCYDRSQKADESMQNRKRTEVIWRRRSAVQPRIEILNLFASGKFDCFD